MSSMMSPKSAIAPKKAHICVEEALGSRWGARLWVPRGANGCFAESTLFWCTQWMDGISSEIERAEANLEVVFGIGTLMRC